MHDLERNFDTKDLTGFRRITNFGFGKYRLPNLLAFVGFRLFMFFQKISKSLILLAISLNPYNLFFRKKLEIIARESSSGLEKIKVPVFSIPEGCARLGSKITFLSKNQVVELTKPRVLNSSFYVSPLYETTANLPDTYVAELKNAMIFGGTDLVLMEKSYALYDELAHKNSAAYEIKSPVVEKVSDTLITLSYQNENKTIIGSGIHFIKDHSRNYFHWLVECLPRLLLIDQIQEAKKLPLLVDFDLAPQQIEALQLINQDNRQLIFLQNKSKYLVENLYYPSQLSVIHDNLHSPIKHNEDIVYSPLALNFVRNFFLGKMDIQKGDSFRKIYISRKSAYRNVTNNEKIEELMASQGFEIIFPEKLSFTTQVKMFSQARVVIGQSGAGMANLLFVPKNCRALIFISDDEHTNLHVFHAFCQILGINMHYLIGESRKDHSMHSDFSINLKLLESYIHSG